AYAVETTPVNILDWATAYAFPLTATALAALDLPVLVLCGGSSHPAIQRANELLAESLKGSFHLIEGAAHFMISTHATEVARLAAGHVNRSATQTAPDRRVNWR